MLKIIAFSSELSVILWTKSLAARVIWSKISGDGFSGSDPDGEHVHAQQVLVLQGQEGEQLLAEDQGWDADRLAENVIVEHLQVRLCADQRACGAGDHAQDQQQAGQQRQAAGNGQGGREQVADAAAVLSEIAAVKDL